ncbi:hypothetical protein Pst134EA_022493 [Puccinia striiformis f. sp. tritici]|uniref:hypothetical protein n=1 Tax=Puccinia striiformis f. sp. tritici TaxID=168172 RepID=UPI002007B3CD|nr:hypothetical protein Pst134EA_022493 [Puccinia striiformis f. sp. tritici]KAH9455007.1 hypothetical protein Pst134EA_022493 [Puccinia striiformis f. sp. tritici]
MPNQPSSTSQPAGAVYSSTVEMGQETFVRPPDQLSDSYEKRIRHLEGVVHFLLANSNFVDHARFTCVSAVPLAGSFRYSMDRGLIPLLSKTTADSLTSDWRNKSLKGLRFSNRPSSSSNHSVSTKPRSASSSPRSTDTQARPLDTGLLTQERRPSLLNDRSPPLPTSPYLQSFNTMTLNPNKRASLRLDSLADLKVVHDQLPFIKPSPSDPNSHSPLFKPLSSYINIPATPPTVPDSTRPRVTSGIVLSQLDSPTSPPPVIPDKQLSLTVESLPRSSGQPKDTPTSPNGCVKNATTSAHPSANALGIQPCNYLPSSSATDTSTITDSSPLASTPDSTKTLASLMPSEAHALHSIILTQRSNSANVVKPNNSSLLDNTPATPTAIVVESHDRSSTSSIDDGPTSSRTHEHQLNSISAADGAISPTSLSPTFKSNLTDSTSSSDLINKNISNYLELPDVNETKRKKKKKKKKTTSSGSNPCLPSAPSELQTAAVGGLSVMGEEELAALERKNDPRYRPIEDSEFIGWDDCIGSPTSTPDNQILFYV